MTEPKHAIYGKGEKSFELRAIHWLLGVALTIVLTLVGYIFEDFKEDIKQTKSDIVHMKEQDEILKKNMAELKDQILKELSVSNERLARIETMLTMQKDKK